MTSRTDADAAAERLDNLLAHPNYYPETRLCSGHFADLRAVLSAYRARGEALAVFAAIEPSSGVAQDGSEDEPYQVFLACRDRYDFTGKDLARARAVLGKGEEK